MNLKLKCRFQSLVQVTPRVLIQFYGAINDFCIFTGAFYAIGTFVDAITNMTTIITNRQTNFCFILRALYQVSFSNFPNVFHYIQKFGKQCKIRWTKVKN